MPGKKKKAKKKAVDELSAKDLGNAAFVRQEYSKAIEYYSRALAEDAENHVLYSNRSAAFLGVGTQEAFALALADAEKCVLKNPTWAKGFLRKAGALHALGRTEEAEAAVAEGLKLEPDDNNAPTRSSFLDLAEELKKPKAQDQPQKQTEQTEEKEIIDYSILDAEPWLGRLPLITPQDKLSQLVRLGQIPHYQSSHAMYNGHYYVPSCCCRYQSWRNE